MKNLVTIVSLLVLVSCSSNCDNVSSIMLPDNMKLLSGNYKKQYEGIYSEIRMIAYYDSTYCNNCAIRNFNMWARMINTMESYNDCASIVFIFAPRRSEVLKIKTMLDEYVVDYPVYLDTAFCFGNINPRIKQSFFGLIDKNNNIILSGYPFDSSKSYSQYIDTFNNMVINEKK